MMNNYAYRVQIEWSEEDLAFIAVVPDLPGAMADGKTRAEALSNVEAIIQEWIETAQELGRPIPQPMDRMMTVPETADRLGLSVAMVRRYCQNSRLPAKKVGRDWAMRQEDVEIFATSSRRQGRKPKRYDQMDSPPKTNQGRSHFVRAVREVSERTDR
jgi:excisionase family DNA binding protein